MKKIVIISFYELKDYLLYIKELFESFHFNVINYPLYRYAYDANDKIDNYKEHMDDFIQSQNPDIILWWFIDVPIDVFKYIKQNNKNKLFIMYNSDDPLNLTKELFDKAKIFDIVISPCKETMYLYKLYSNVNIVLFGPMGHDPSLFNKNNGVSNTEFDCDISMLSYNLYLDKSYYQNQVVYKKDLIDNIVDLSQKKGYVFKLFGTPILKELYPLNYCGEIPYYKLNFLFSSSKINIVSSPFKDKSLYVNEYVIPILGCSSLLMHDKTKDIEKLLEDNVNCVLYDDTDYIDKIDDILGNYDKYTQIKEMSAHIATHYSWDIWVENIVKEIGKMSFNKEFYSELYDLDSNLDLLNYWLETGIKEKQLCFDFIVPESFNAEEYISANNLKNNDKIAYFHWYTGPKDNIYMKKTKNLSRGMNEGINMDVSNYNILMEDYYDISCILNKVIKYDTKEEGLLQLNDYCKTIPYTKINNILDKYIESIY